MADLTNTDATDNNDNQTVVLTNKNTFNETGILNNPIRNSPTDYAPHLTTTGTLSVLNAGVTTSVLDGFGTAGIIITGTWLGTIVVQASVDGTNYVTTIVVPIGSGLMMQSITSNGSFRVNITGLKSIRVLMSLFTSGVATASIQLTVDAGFTRTLSNVAGSSDGSQIGNVGDRLKVDASVVLAGGATQSYTKKLRYEDMNITTGTLARGAPVTALSGWNKAYGYAGTGLLSGVVISLETKDDWAIRIVVDGDEIFGTGTGLGILSTDLHTDSIYDADTSGRSVPELDQDLGVFWGAHDRFQWVGPLLIPITFNTSVDVYIRRVVAASTKKFQAGYVVIEKRT